MKKFFAAICCCALVGLNVTAQEPNQTPGIDAAHSIIEAPDSEATPASTIQEETPTPDVSDSSPSDVIVDEAQAMIVDENSMNQNGMVNGFVAEQPMSQGYLQNQAPVMPYMHQTFTAGPMVAGCGCGQSTAVMNYSSGTSIMQNDMGMNYDSGIASAPAVVEGGNSWTQSASAGCGCAENVYATGNDCCYDNGRSRPQVLNRFRGRFTSVRGGRLGNRWGNDCCNDCCN